MSKKKAVLQADQLEPVSVKQAVANMGAKKTPQELFADEYNELCKRHGYQLSFLPQWKQSMDTGTFSLVIQVAVMENPKGMV